MLNVSSAVKQAYQSGSPNVYTKLVIDGTEYTSRNLVAGSVSITESLCSLETFDLSSVEKNELEFSLFNETQAISDLLGKTVVATHVLTLPNNTVVNIPLGTYTIATSEYVRDYIIRCKCYDVMNSFDKIIDDWWNTQVTFPITLRNLVTALFTEVGVTYDIPTTFNNSSFTITTRNSFFENVKASDLLGQIQEIVGGFFKADRYGTVRLLAPSSSEALQPHISLYPSTGLYPSEGNIGYGSNSKTSRYEYQNILGELTIADYTVDAVTKLQIRGTEEDVGIIVGTGTNTYVIQGNVLLLNLSDDASSRALANNILNAVKVVTYVPFTGNFTAQPYVEVGDYAVVVSYKGLKATSPILYRRLSGQNLAVDSFVAKGSNKRQIVTKVNKQIKVLNQKTHEVSETVDGLTRTVTNINTELNGEGGVVATVTTHSTQIQQNADAITLRATKTEAQQYANDAEAAAKSYADSLVAGELTVFYRATQPTSTESKENDLWINTADGNALYRYDGTSWLSIQDSDIQTALVNAATAQSTADGKIKTFAQTTPPTASDIGDLWVDTDDNNKLHRWSGSAWVAYTDASALQAFLNDTYATDKSNLQNQIDGKAETWYQSTNPATAWTTTALKDAHVGDLWYNTTNQTTWYYQKSGSTYDWVQQNIPSSVFDEIDGKAQIFTSQPTPPYNAGDLWFVGTNGDILTCVTPKTTGQSYAQSDWEKKNKYTDDTVANAANGLAQSALNTANSKITTYYQTTSPATANTGDLWIDTDDSNKLYRYDGTSWASVRDSGIQTALTNAATAQATADGKIVTFAQSTQPTATDIGDLWIDTGNNNKMYRWDGTTWNSTLTGNSIVSLINLDSSGVQISGSKVNIDTTTLNLTFGSQNSSVTIQSTTNNDGVLFTGSGKVNFETNGEFYAKNYDSSNHIANSTRLAVDGTTNSAFIKNRFNNLSANVFQLTSTSTDHSIWYYNYQIGQSSANANNMVLQAGSSNYRAMIHNFNFEYINSTSNASVLANRLSLYSTSGSNEASLENYSVGTSAGASVQQNVVLLIHNKTDLKNSIEVNNYDTNHILRNSLYLYYPANSPTEQSAELYNKNANGKRTNSVQLKFDVNGAPFLGIRNYEKDSSSVEYVSTVFNMWQNVGVGSNSFAIYNNKKNSTTSDQTYNANLIDGWSRSDWSQNAIRLKNNHWNGTEANMIEMASTNDSSYLLIRNKDDSGNIKTCVDMNSDGSLLIQTNTGGVSKIKVNTNGNMDVLANNVLVLGTTSSTGGLSVKTQQWNSSLKQGYVYWYQNPNDGVYYLASDSIS